MADIQTELNVLDNKLQAQLDAANRARNTNIILGVILIAIIFVYFKVIGGKLEQFSEPKQIAEVVSGKILEHMPNVSEYIDKQAKTQVPVLVDNAITYIVKERIPAARKQLEDEVKSRMDDTVVKTEAGVVDAFEKGLKDHGKNLPDLVKNLQTDDGKKAFEEDLYKTLEDSVKSEDVAAQIDHYGMALADVDRMLKFYADPKSEKTAEEVIVCDMIAMMRELSDRAVKSGTSPSLENIKMGIGVKSMPEVENSEPSEIDTPKESKKANDKPAEKKPAATKSGK